MNDVENIMLIFYISKNDMDKEWLEIGMLPSIIFLLNRDHDIKFYYMMKFLPLPSSDLLDEDIHNLIDARYLKKKIVESYHFANVPTYPVAITEKGEEFIEKKGIDVINSMNKISEPLKRYSQWSVEDFFANIYENI